MNSSLSHLPELKQDELRRLTEVICAASDYVELIVLFGSYARGDYKEAKDIPADAPSGHASDYDIFVVVRNEETEEDSRLWANVNERLSGLTMSAKPRLVVHGWPFVKTRLRQQHYFYSDIIREGIALYDSERYEPHIPDEIPEEEKSAIAQEHFKKWYAQANDFSIDQQNAMERGSLNISTFYLHQAAESAYKCVLLIFTNYIPYGHYLEEFDALATEILPEIADIFPRTTQVQKEQFQHFDLAYVAARYSPTYQMERADLEYLAERVRMLLQVVRECCENKIAIES